MDGDAEAQALLWQGTPPGQARRAPHAGPGGLLLPTPPRARPQQPLVGLFPELEPEAQVPSVCSGQAGAPGRRGGNGRKMFVQVGAQAVLPGGRRKGRGSRRAKSACPVARALASRLRLLTHRGRAAHSRHLVDKQSCLEEPGPPSARGLGLHTNPSSLLPPRPPSSL